MRYSIIAAALLSAVSAVPLTETLYSTEVKTITSCGADVVSCPGKATSTPAPAPVTTSCTEGHKESWSAPPVYHSTTSAVPPPVTTSAAPPKSYPPPPEKETSKPAVPSSEAPKPPKSEYPPAPPKSESPPPASKTSEAPAPPPVSSKPAVSTVKASISSGTGIVPYKTSSASWAASSTPAKYTGAASHLNAAGFVAGAGILGALFI